MERYINQYQELKVKHPGAVAIFRCGDIYQSIKSDAVTLSNVLGLTIKSVDGKTDVVDFPLNSLDRNLGKLIKSGYRVAIYDQIED